LLKSEMDDAVGDLESKVAKWRPEAVCIVGKSIWESIYRVKYGGPMKKGEFSYGWQGERRMGRVDGEEGWEGARVFVATTTSGLSTTPGGDERERIWREVGEWVNGRRRERGDVVGGAGGVGGSS
jgi:TDG/mug DNA glycosylase family protein